MVRSECKKIFNRKISCLLLLCLIVSALAFFLRLTGVRNGADTPEIQRLYRTLRGKSRKEASAALQAEKTLIAETLGREAVMREMYRKGEVGAEDYIAYRDRYHACKAKKDAVDYVYGRCLQMEERGGEMVFDLYYCQLFDRKRIPVGLLLSILFISMLPVSCESGRLLAVLAATPAGKKGIWRAKLQTVACAAAGTAALYTAMECLLYRHFLPFEGLSLPAQSIQALSGVSLPISIGGWLALYGVGRVAVSVLLGMLLFCVQYRLAYSQ